MRNTLPAYIQIFSVLMWFIFPCNFSLSLVSRIKSSQRRETMQFDWCNDVTGDCEFDWGEKLRINFICLVIVICHNFVSRDCGNFPRTVFAIILYRFNLFFSRSRLYRTHFECVQANRVKCDQKKGKKCMIKRKKETENWNCDVKRWKKKEKILCKREKIE